MTTISGSGGAVSVFDLLDCEEVGRWAETGREFDVADDWRLVKREKKEPRRAVTPSMRKRRGVDFPLMPWRPVRVIGKLEVIVRGNAARKSALLLS